MKKARVIGPFLFDLISFDIKDSNSFRLVSRLLLSKYIVHF